MAATSARGRVRCQSATVRPALSAGPAVALPGVTARTTGRQAHRLVEHAEGERPPPRADVDRVPLQWDPSRGRGRGGWPLGSPSLPLHPSAQPSSPPNPKPRSLRRPRPTPRGVPRPVDALHGPRGAALRGWPGASAPAGGGGWPPDSHSLSPRAPETTSLTAARPPPALKSPIHLLRRDAGRAAGPAPQRGPGRGGRGARRARVRGRPGAPAGADARGRALPGPVRDFRRPGHGGRVRGGRGDHPEGDGPDRGAHGG